MFKVGDDYVGIEIDDEGNLLIDQDDIEEAVVLAEMGYPMSDLVKFYDAWAHLEYNERWKIVNRGGDFATSGDIGALPVYSYLNAEQRACLSLSLTEKDRADAALYADNLNPELRLQMIESIGTDEAWSNFLGEYRFLDEQRQRQLIDQLAPEWKGWLARKARVLTYPHRFELILEAPDGEKMEFLQTQQWLTQNQQFVLINSLEDEESLFHVLRLPLQLAITSDQRFAFADAIEDPGLREELARVAPGLTDQQRALLIDPELEPL
jgi:hypothetical protein